MAFTGTDIADRILAAVMARKLAPGERLGEQQLALLFDCSRTIVREALTQLATRGVVRSSARRGWYVVQPTMDEAREAIEARAVIEQGLIRRHTGLSKASLAQLRQHLQQQRDALAGTDDAASSFLLGDFHVCLARCLGNDLLADTLRDFTARTTLVAMLYQSREDAQASCADHVQIVDALARGDTAEAERLMGEHLLQVLASLQTHAHPDRLAQLRAALSPVSSPAAPGGESSTYLGALL